MCPAHVTYYSYITFSSFIVIISGSHYRMYITRQLVVVFGIIVSVVQAVTRGREKPTL